MKPELGCGKDALDTPALCVDLDVLESNIRAVAKTCRDHGVEWRPHSKCHKSPAIAQKLIDAGAIGVTCAKLGEAEVMGAGGIRDLLIANQVVGTHKVPRLVALRRIADPIVCVDSIEQATEIARAMHAAGLAVRTLIEVDIGLARAGTQPGDATVALARQLSALPGITFAGLMGYEGHLLRIADPAEKTRRIHEDLEKLVVTKRQIEAAGIPCPIVSCGGSGSYVTAVSHAGITEIQAGGAIFMDDFYRDQCHVAGLGFALTVLATVVSRPVADRAIIDAGRKTMNPEIVMPRVVSREGLEVQQLSAEHGKLGVSGAAGQLRIGDRVELLPGYSDLTCVLHDNFYGFRNGKLEVIWPLEGRGKLQ